MSFWDAFKFPFQQVNLPKILTIVLIFLIVVVSFSLVALTLNSLNYLFFLPIIVLVYGLLVGGYSIAVIQNILRGENVLPGLSFLRDLGRGMALVIGGILYSIPFGVVYICMFAIFGVTASSSYSSFDAPMMQTAEPSAVLLMSLCGIGLFMIFSGFVLSYAFIVGMIRYAATDSSGSLYDVIGNSRLVLSNFGAVFNLLFYQVGLGIIYSIVSSLLMGVFVGLFPQQFINMGEMVSDPIGVGFLTAFYLVVLTVNLMSFISSLYLFAQFGFNIGVMDSELPKAKRKHDYDDL